MQEIVNRTRSFLVDDALPFWSSTGAYGNGCFVERLNLNGQPVDPGFTRVRVQARQLYVFSHAEAIGLFRAPDLTDRAADFLITSAWQGESLGWAKLVDREGRVLDGTTDLYDVAFALFALAWRYRVANDPACLALAHKTLDFIDAHLKRSSGGYANDGACSYPRQQNPHMHLTEAMVAWAEVSSDCRFLNKAAEIIALYETQFTDPVTGALGEFFNEDWTPVSGPLGDLVEPGHQFEWTWIIGKYETVSGRPKRDLMRRVLDFGLHHGFNPDTGLTVDQVDRSGRIIAGSQRLWPQTEAIKATISAAEFLNDAQPKRLAKIVDAFFAKYLDCGPLPGTWIDHFDAAGNSIATNVPSSSLYHITLAFCEILRFAEKAGGNNEVALDANDQ